MHTKSFLSKLAILGAIGLSTFSGQASSAVVSLNYETTSAGTATVNPTINTPAVPGSHTFGNSFTAPTPAFSGIYGFYDDYIFTISGATVNAVSTTIDLGMLKVINLEQRLFNYVGNPTPTLGIPTGAVTNAWSVPISTFGIVTVLPATVLASGTYVLQTRGTVTGLNGGSYAGTLNLAPVPVPTAAWLLGSGLLGLIGVARGRETA